MDPNLKIKKKRKPKFDKKKDESYTVKHFFKDFIPNIKFKKKKCLSEKCRSTTYCAFKLPIVIFILKQNLKKLCK